MCVSSLVRCVCGIYPDVMHLSLLITNAFQRIIVETHTTVGLVLFRIKIHFLVKRKSREIPYKKFDILASFPPSLIFSTLHDDLYITFISLRTILRRCMKVCVMRCGTKTKDSGENLVTVVMVIQSVDWRNKVSNSRSSFSFGCVGRWNLQSSLIRFCGQNTQQTRGHKVGELQRNLHNESDDGKILDIFCHATKSVKRIS